MRWLSYLEKKLIFINDKQDISAVKNSPMSPFKNLQVYAYVGAWVLIEEYLLYNILYEVEGVYL